jgi:hypothetical protein
VEEKPKEEVYMEKNHNVVQIKKLLKIKLNQFDYILKIF